MDVGIGENDKIEATAARRGVYSGRVGSHAVGLDFRLYAGPGPESRAGGSAGAARAPQEIIDQHIDRQWMKKNMLQLLEHWMTASPCHPFVAQNDPGCQTFCT